MRREIETFNGVECILDRNVESSFSKNAFFLFIRTGSIFQLPLNYRNVLRYKIYERDSPSERSLYEAGLSQGDSFRNTPLIMTFNILTFEDNERGSPLTDYTHNIQSSHYFKYEETNKTYQNARASLTNAKAVPLTSRNTTLAEFMFDHKFSKYQAYKTDSEIKMQDNINITELFEKFKDSSIVNNETLKAFLLEDLDLGTGITFNMDERFATNLRLYSDFVMMTSGIFMSCIEGNHRLYTAMSTLIGIENSFPLVNNADFKTDIRIPNNCSILRPHDMHIITFPFPNKKYKQKKLIKSGKYMSRKCMKNQETKISGKWDEYMRRTSQRLETISTFETCIDMRKYEYIVSKNFTVAQTQLGQLNREIFMLLTKTFDDMPLKANIYVTDEEIQQLEDYRNSGKFSIINRLPSHVSSVIQIIHCIDTILTFIYSIIITITPIFY